MSSFYENDPEEKKEPSQEGQPSDVENPQGGQPEQPPVQRPREPYSYTPPQQSDGLDKKWSYDHSNNPFNPYQQQTPPPYYPSQNNRYGSQPPVGGREPRKPGKSTGFKVFVIVLAAVVAISLSIGGAYSIYENFVKPQVGASSGSSSNNTSSASSNAEGIQINSAPGDTISPSLGEGGMTVSQVSEKVGPSTVGIVNYALNSMSASAEGTGIIMNKDGYILTNAHVISGAASLKVVLESGEDFAAQVVGSDSKTDIAVIKIDPKSTTLTPAEFGDSTKLQKGEFVVAIGNPGGLDYAGSVTFGIISGLNREADSSGLTSYIQTDAAINPGNSGGPLVNLYGQVIGINSAKIVNEDVEGIGFAIPISEAQPIVSDLISVGYVQGRVKLGISGEEIDAYVSKINNIPTGIYIDSIDPESDLTIKGVRKGDIITTINGVKITSFEVLFSELYKYKPDDEVELGIYRYAGTSASPTQFTVKIKLLQDKGD